MELSEFNIIERYLMRAGMERSDVLIGVGDDCALLQVPQGQSLAVSMDTLIEGRHFAPDTRPEDIAYKAVAVNLSDLAAMGAEPAWLTLSLSLPKAEPDWLQAFSDSLFERAHHYHLQVVGGDTTRGNLSITIQAHGFVPADMALRRSGAKPGDLIMVTGTLGDACAGLKVWMGELQVEGEIHDFLLKRLERPEPRLAAGIALRSYASACIDISDGFLADLGHILKRSSVGAQVNVEQLPLSPALRDSLSEEQAIACALAGGDDYELCFTLPEEKWPALEKNLSVAGVGVTCIGRVQGKSGIKLQKHGKDYAFDEKGFDHFSANGAPTEHL